MEACLHRLQRLRRRGPARSRRGGWQQITLATARTRRRQLLHLQPPVAAAAQPFAVAATGAAQPATVVVIDAAQPFAAAAVAATAQPVTVAVLAGSTASASDV